MPKLAFSDFDAFTFDVYGTLIDWQPTMTAFLSEGVGFRWMRRR